MNEKQNANSNRRWWNIRAKGFLFVSLLVSVAFLAGCADVKIKVHRHLYKPLVPDAVSSFYKGKHIDILSFINTDEKTKRWSYYSPDRKVAYETSVPLEYYLMDCFRDAFWIAGASVTKDNPDPKIPDMLLIIDNWTDVEMKFTVTLTKDNFLKFKNQYVILMPSVDKGDAAKLEKNAYEMTNKAIVAVMSDPNFQAVFQ